MVVTTASGAQIEGDTLVVGIGIQPNVEVAEQAGVHIENGIVVGIVSIRDLMRVVVDDESPRGV